MYHGMIGLDGPRYVVKLYIELLEHCAVVDELRGLVEKAKEMDRRDQCILECWSNCGKMQNWWPRVTDA
jgi:hypothetical protein